MAAMVYAAKIIKDLGLTGDYTLLLSGSVQEEDCDGLSWQYIIEQDGIIPKFVVLTEPSEGMIRQGQRGRMEIMITTFGRSAHGATPDRGVNAIYKMAPIITAIERLNATMEDDGILGPGNVTISEIYSTSPSRCAVADSCRISLDRRLNTKETPEFALRQLQSLKEVQDANAEVSLYTFNDPSYTGLVYPIDKFYPTWLLDKNDSACICVAEAYQKILRKEAVIKPWLFSTNGVAIMGRHNIPCVGFGPGHENMAHSPNEVTWKSELVNCCAVYAVIPLIYTKHHTT
jgi:putative selenium metabolism hydrolase